MEDRWHLKPSHVAEGVRTSSVRPMKPYLTGPLACQTSISVN